MSTSLRGELTEVSKTRFEHPASEQLPPNIAVMTMVGYAIADGDVTTFQDCLKTEGDKLLDQIDYLGNSVLVISNLSKEDVIVIMLIQVQQHLAALGPSDAILNELLTRGASVHLRNNSGHTPLYLAAEAGLLSHVKILRDAGAHIHERELAGFHSATPRNHENGSLEVEGIWDLALAPTRSH